MFNLKLFRAQTRHFMNRKGNKIIEQIESLATSLAAWAEALDAEQDALAKAEAESIAAIKAKHDARDSRYARRIARIRERRTVQTIKAKDARTATHEEFARLQNECAESKGKAEIVARNLAALTSE